MGETELGHCKRNPFEPRRQEGPAPAFKLQKIIFLCPDPSDIVPSARFLRESLLSLTFCFVFAARPCILHANPEPMATATPQTRHYWIFSADPHHYHWDTLFVKGKEMWHGAGAKPDAVRALKQVKKGDRVLCYHSAPERSIYSIAEVTRDPYPDPHDYDGKNLRSGR
jgi:EVE domain